jgi:hypothetical protein
VQNSGIETADIRSLQLLLSGETILAKGSEGFVSGFLGNVILERLFLGSSKKDNRMNLSDLMIARRIDLESVDISILSVEALDSLLLSEIISVESEDSLLQFILKLGSGYRDLLRHIQLEFLSEDSFGTLDEHLGIPPESVWQCAVEWTTHPLSRSFDSRIISEFPEIFAKFRGKHFELLWRGTRGGFKGQNFTADVTVTQTL